MCSLQNNFQDVLPVSGTVPDENRPLSNTMNVASVYTNNNNNNNNRCTSSALLLAPYCCHHPARTAAFCTHPRGRGGQTLSVRAARGLASTHGI